MPLGMIGALIAGNAHSAAVMTITDEMISSRLMLSLLGSYIREGSTTRSGLCSAPVRRGPVIHRAFNRTTDDRKVEDVWSRTDHELILQMC